MNQVLKRLTKIPVLSTALYFLLLLILRGVSIDPVSDMVYPTIGLGFSLMITACLIFCNTKVKQSEHYSIAKNIIVTIFILLLSFKNYVGQEKSDCFGNIQYFLIGLLYSRFISRKQCKEKQSTLKLNIILAVLTLLFISLGLFSDIQSIQLPQCPLYIIIVIVNVLPVYLQYQEFQKSRELMKKLQEADMNSASHRIKENQDFSGQQSFLHRESEERKLKYLSKTESLKQPLSCQHQFTNSLKANGLNSLESVTVRNDFEDQVVVNFEPLNNSRVAEQLQEQRRNFYKFLFNQFPDGMMVLGEDDHIHYINYCFSNLLNTHTRQGSLQKLLSLLNCQEEFKEEAQFHQMFRALDQKFSNQNIKNPRQLMDEPNDDFVEYSESDVYSSQSGFESAKEDILNINIETFISKCKTVGEEYNRAIQSAQKLLDSQRRKKNNPIKNMFYKQKSKLERFSNGDFSQISMAGSTVNKSDHIKFLYESKLICRVGEVMESDSFIEQKFRGSRIRSQSKQLNKSRLLEVTLKPYIYEGKPFVLVLLRDVTLFNQFTVLQQINQNKSKMLSQVAHEFRTPLNCIILLTETLIEQTSDENMIEEYYSPINTSASQLLNLVNDLLDLAQLRAGKFKITCSEFDLAKLVISIQRMMLPSAQQRKLYLDVQIDEKLPQMIQSDPNRIRQIIMNLIGNALKFTSQGGITITVQIKETNIYLITVKDTGIGIDPQDQGKLFQAFGKIDKTSHMNSQGVGLGLMISNIMAQRLSQKGDTSSNICGAGLEVYSEGRNQGASFSFKIYDQIELDLARTNSNQVVKTNTLVNSSNQFARLSGKSMDARQIQMQLDRSQSKFKKKTLKKYAHQFKTQYNNPNIQGESEQDFSPRGLEDDTNFTVAAKQIERSREHSKLFFKDCLCPEILIIDDEPFNIKALIANLSQYKLKLIKAFNHDESISVLQQFKENNCCQWIKVILMDIEMPLKNGFETTKSIREIESSLSQVIPDFQPSYIIGCSGHGGEMKSKCLQEGMNEFFTKPIKRDQLISILKSLIDHSKKFEQI